jgi:hypothetical protein
LRLAALFSVGIQPWVRHGTTIYLWKERDVAKAIEYVMLGQREQLFRLERRLDHATPCRLSYCVETKARESLTLSRASLNNPGDFLLSHTVTRAVPSAPAGLTSVFGMGTGVTLPTKSPEKL